MAGNNQNKHGNGRPVGNGQLARVVAAFFVNNEPANLTWANVCAEIERLFMSEEEQQQIRAGMATIYQKLYQDADAYGRAFVLRART